MRYIHGDRNVIFIVFLRNMNTAFYTYVYVMYINIVVYFAVNFAILIVIMAEIICTSKTKQLVDFFLENVYWHILGK